MSGSEKRNRFSKDAEFWISVALVVIAIFGAVFLVVVSARRNLSSLETTLLQVLILATGLYGSFVFGRQAARTAARELVKPAARSAFRRVLWLYASLGRLRDRLEDLRANDEREISALDVLEALVTEQEASVYDAMEDWRDIVPEDVEEVERRLAARSSTPRGTDT